MNCFLIIWRLFSRLLLTSNVCRCPCSYTFLNFCFTSHRIWQMDWQCKICNSFSTTKWNLLRHYRLQHATFGRGHLQPCLYSTCPNPNIFHFIPNCSCISIFYTCVVFFMLLYFASLEKTKCG